MYLLADLHLPICVTIPHAPRSPLSPLCHVRVSSPPDSDDVQHSRHGDNLKALREKWGGVLDFCFFANIVPYFISSLFVNVALSVVNKIKPPTLCCIVFMLFFPLIIYFLLLHGRICRLLFSFAHSAWLLMQVSYKSVKFLMEWKHLQELYSRSSANCRG